MPVVQIKHIAVSKNAIDMEVACALPYLHVSADAAKRLLEQLPNLAAHVCINEKGDTFGDEIVGTETPHLLEHLIIELMGMSENALGAKAPGRGLIGHTSWADELANTRGEGVALMRVKVRYHNDLVALQACKEACVFIEWAMTGEGMLPSVAASIERLTELAARG